MERRDEGSALILVLGAMTVVMLVVSVALNYGLQTMHHTRHSTEWYQAFAAAEAGVDNYVARLNQDDNYWQTVDCGNRALQGPRTDDACGWNGSTPVGWLDVPGSTDAQFHYDVDVTDTPVDGTIHLVATGRAGGDTTRSIVVTLRRGGFGEFLYYTTYETKDPADYIDLPTPQGDGMSPSEAMKCATYQWAGRDSHCVNITFIGGDQMNGPVHSNDSILMTDGTSSPYTGKGPHFYGTVTTSMPSCNREGGRTVLPTDCYRSGNSPSAGHPLFDKGIGYRSEVDIPQSIGDLRQVVVRGPDSPATLGCLYSGPTRIRFLAASGGATPTMKVWSPYSTLASLNPGCAGTAADTSVWPRVVPVPQNNLIMVQDVPSTQLPLPPSGACAAGSLGTVPDASGTNLPNADDWNQTLDDASCRYGTAYVEGTLKGRVTISADNNIVVIGNLLYQGGPNGTDTLGLIAENSVQIYHPVSKTQSCKDQRTWNGYKWVTTTICTWVRGTSNLTGSLKNPEVNASVLTLNHSFEVQQYDVGSNSCVSGSSACLGKLRVYGSIAQKFRGIVGRGSTGYLKDYNYDSRLRYAPPPYFLDPVRSAWGQKTFGEITPRYGD